MARGLARLGGRAVADRRPAGDQRGPVAGPGGLDGRRHRLRIVAVDRRRVPAVGLEALDLVVGDRERGRPVDRDAVVVEQHDQAAQPQVPGERRGLVADPLHEAAVAGDDIGVMIDRAVAEAGVEHAFAQRHADRVGQPLAQRAGRGLDTRRVAVFRVARRLAAELAEILDLLQGHGLVAGQVEQAVEQHGAVARREHEAVPVGPVRRGGIEPEEAREQDRRHVRHAERHPGVARLGPLDRVHRQGANRVGHILVIRLRRRRRSGGAHCVHVKSVP